MSRALRVLVVDDERNMRFTLAQILREEGFDTAVADNGELAVEMCREEAFDLILMDVRMPGMDGVEAFREIRKHCPATRVIMMSAYTGDDVRSSVLQEGAVAFLRKPLDVDAIIRLMADIKQPAVLLVIEDEQTLNASQATLRDRGYRVTSVASAREALDVIGQIRFDVVLIDADFPGAEAPELERQIRRRDSHISIIWITGDDAKFEQLAAAAPRGRLMRKPVEPAALLNAVQCSSGAS